MVSACFKSSVLDGQPYITFVVVSRPERSFRVRCINESTAEDKTKYCNDFAFINIS